MTDHQPQADFFLPGTAEKEMERIQKVTDATERQVIEAAGTKIVLPGPEDDPEAMLDAFVKSQSVLAGSKIDVDVANEMKQARHNAHITQLRMIEMEKRRQRRDKATGKRDKA